MVIFCEIKVINIYEYELMNINCKLTKIDNIRSTRSTKSTIIKQIDKCSVFFLFTVLCRPVHIYIMLYIYFVDLEII